MTATDTDTEPTGTDLIAFTESNLPAVFSSEKAVEKIVTDIEARARSEVFDVSTSAGRAAARSLANQVARSKTLLDATGKQLGDEARKVVDSLNASRRKIRDRLDSLKEEVRRPLTEWEEIEKKRIEALEKRLAGLEELGDFPPNAGSESLKDALAKLEAIVIDETWQEFQRDAEAAVAVAKKRLEDAITAAERVEELEREAAQLRAQAAEAAKIERERIEREAAEEAARQEAARKAEIERLAEERAAAARVEVERAAKEKAEREAQERIERAEREKAEAEQRAKDAAEAERRRAEAEKAAEEEAQRKREEDTKHRTRIINAATKAIASLPGQTEAKAKAVVLAIAEGKVPHVKVEF